MTLEEDAMRELFRAATPDLDGVEMDDITRRVQDRSTRCLRHHRFTANGTTGGSRGVWAIAAVIAAVVIVGVLVALLGSDSRSHSTRPATPLPSPVDYNALVLRDGDTVTASGKIVAIPGRPVQLCDPYVGEDQTGGRQPITRCPGITVTGVNLRDLTSRRVVGGSISGMTAVTGIYHAGRIAVTGQARPSNIPGPAITNFDRSPCPAPAGGWPTGHDVSFAAIHSYAKAHSGSIVIDAELHPRPAAPIAYVVTAGNPEPVRRALTASLGKRLCVVHSSYRPAQIAQARRAFSIFGSQAQQAGITDTGFGLNEKLQPTVTVTVKQLTPTLARAATRLPSGVFTLTIWLTPQH